eukprot:7385912-Prymnesium_polylepis.2
MSVGPCRAPRPLTAPARRARSPRNRRQQPCMRAPCTQGAHFRGYDLFKLFRTAGEMSRPNMQARAPRTAPSASTTRPS